MGYKSIELPSPIVIPKPEERRVINKTGSPAPRSTIYIIYTDGTVAWRKGCRSSNYVIDKTLTALGFSGIETVDWENVITIYNEIVIPVTYIQYKDEVGIWRKGCRDSKYILDKTTTLLGFAGIEDTDWENILKLS